MQKEIKRITKKIVKEFNPEKIILFGSFVWGKPREDSDVDLFIVKDTNKKILDRERELQSLLFGNDFPAIDLLVYTPEELEKRLVIKDFFINDIIKKGKVLYEK